MRRYAPKLEKHYDLAISFFRPFDFIVEKVDADVKVGWVHTDYSNAGEDLQFLEKDYKRMDYIAAVSNQCAEAFKRLFQNLGKKVITVENILSKDCILKEAEKEDITHEMPSDGTIRLLSIGRFTFPKRFDEVPEITKRIYDAGIHMKWYLIGYGGDEALIRQKIVEAGMQDHIIILGKKENPYPYIKACDIYVQPSRYEGKSVAVREAQILNKPVIITNYTTASSQLEDGVDGVIVPMDIEGCAKGIAEVIRDKELQQRLIENTKKKDYANTGEIEKLYRLMERQYATD
jgi:glycosyltransferase involved in cell wall biosynthesis